MYKTIVVGTDGSGTARQAVAHAAGLAAQSGATLHVVHAFRSPEAALMIDPSALPISPHELNEQVVGLAHQICEEAAGEAKAAGATVQLHSVPGEPAEVLINVAENVEADLIIVGNRGMSGMRRFLLGSVPNKVAHHAHCHVMILRTTQ